MIKNAFINAILAEAYIILVVLIINYIGKYEHVENGTIIIPIAVLSLFVLSAAIMGYLFVFKPADVYLNGEKDTAVKLFLYTLLIFTIISTTVLLLVLLGI